MEFDGGMLTAVQYLRNIFHKFHVIRGKESQINLASNFDEIISLAFMGMESISSSGRKLIGKCLCGAIQVSMADEFLYAEYCHCPGCRASSGSAFSAFARIRKEKLQALTEEWTPILVSCPRNKHVFRRRSVGCFSRRSEPDWQ
jgi:Glutathione-dependent formaldehyde-activating enzyme